MTVTAEQATSADAQREELSGRASVPEGTGMWFPIDLAQSTEVWTHDTRMPFDVVWIRDGRVEGVVTLQPCTTANAPASPHQASLTPFWTPRQEPSQTSK